MLLLHNLGVTSYFLALCYLIAGFITWTKYRSLRRLTRKWDLTKFFVISMLLCCVMRFMSFATLCILDFEEISYSYSDAAEEFKTADSDQAFYDKVVIVLFDLPDFTIVSTYVLLILVWAESFQQSRLHWMSQQNFRRQWMVAFLYFNSVLYSCQLVLYGLLFLDFGSTITILDVIYLSLSSIELMVPIVAACSWFTLSLHFSGFMYRSPLYKFRLEKVSRVITVWTCGRVIWGVVALTSVVEDSFASKIDETEYSMVLVALYLLTELTPFIVALDYQLLSLLCIEEDGYSSLNPALVTGTTDSSEMGGEAVAHSDVESIGDRIQSV